VIVRGSLNEARKLLAENLDAIAAHDYLQPMTTLLDDRLAELKAIRDWRQRQTAAVQNPQ
jgi:hypothetical protein